MDMPILSDYKLPETVFIGDNHYVILHAISVPPAPFHSIVCWVHLGTNINDITISLLLYTVNTANDVILLNHT